MNVMRPVRSSLFALAALLILPACGGASSSAPPEAAPPPAPPIASGPDFTQIGAEVERWSVADVTLIIGDASGELYRYEKGRVRADTQVNIASATKLQTGLAVWSLIEAGTLSEATRPQDHLVFWTDDPADARAAVTIDHLLSFRSGFNSRPAQDVCAGDAGQSLDGCVRSLHDRGVDTLPGEGFAYGPDHMQIAARIAQAASGQALSDTMRADIWDPAGAGGQTGFASGSDNVRYSGGLRSTAEDYGKVLRALVAGDLVPLDTGFLADRTAGAQIVHTVASAGELGLDWHYGFGFWIECDTVPFGAACADRPTISSPGAFGFLPWVDFGAGYWAVLSMEEPVTLTARPSVEAVRFQQTLQPLIEREF